MAIKRLFFSNPITRDRNLLDAFISVCFVFGYFPHIILSAFLRKNFGERYFNIWTAGGLTFLGILPFILSRLDSRLFRFLKSFKILETFDWFWVVFMIVFFAFSIKRHLEIGFKLFEYDFSKYSLYDGDFNLPWHKFPFKKLGINDSSVHNFIIQVALEPLVFLLIGLVFIIFPFSRTVGVFLIVSSVMYSGTNFGRYLLARHSFLHENDELMLREAHNKIFFGDGKIPEIPKNIKIATPVKLPEDTKHRKALYNKFYDDISEVS